MKRLFAPKPALNVELSEKHTKTRGALAIGFLVVGLIAFGFFLFSLLGKESGWQKISLSNKLPEVSNEITLTYNIGQSGFAATAEYKKVASVYTEAATKAYYNLDVYEEHDGVVGLYTLNKNPNVEYEVDPFLYEAFELLSRYQVRYQFLAPIYDEYDSAFLVETNDYFASQLDPYKTAETAIYYGEITAFTNSAEHIRVELLGNNKVKLFVSEDYLAFADENDIELFVDFAWLKNAFIIDEAAKALISEGLTLGNLVSVEGYVRNLDPSATDYSYNFYAVVDNVIYPAARLDYTGADSFVAYRDYPLNESDLSRYLPLDDGSIITFYIDPADGKYKSAARNMTFHANDMGVAELAIATAPIFISEAVDKQPVLSLVQAGVSAVWCEGEEKLFYTGGGISVVAFQNGETVFAIEKITK